MNKTITSTFLIVILVLPVSGLNLSTSGNINEYNGKKSVYEWISDTGSGYNGYDYGAQEWVNSHQARNSFSNYYNKLDNMGIAIFDSGIDPDVWQWIENKGGDVVNYIRPTKLTDCWPGLGCFSSFATVTSSSSSYANDETGHGSAVAGAVWQVAQTAKLYIFDIDYLPRHFSSSPQEWVQLQQRAEEMAFKWLHQNENENIRVFTSSVKVTGGSNLYDRDDDNDGLTVKEMVEDIHDRGTIFFTAGGNSGYSNRYPDAYPEFHAVSAHDTPSGERSVWCCGQEAGYGPTIEFTGPDAIDVVKMKNIGDQSGIDVKFESASGTSITTPFVAGIAAVVISAYSYFNSFTFGGQYYDVWPSAATVFNIMKEAAEVVFEYEHQFGIYLQDNSVPNSILNGWVHGEALNSQKYRGSETGWGVPDLYDSIQIIRYQL